MPPITSSRRVDDVNTFADATMATTLGSGRALRALARELGEHEQLLAVGAGVTGGRKSLVAATSQRLIVLSPSRFGMRSIEVANGAIDHVDIGVRLAGSVLTVRTAEGTHLVRGMAHAEAAMMKQALTIRKPQSRSA